MSQEHLMTLAELMEYLGITYYQALRLRTKTDMPKVKVGKMYMYRATSIKAWLDKLEQNERDSISG